MKEYKYSTSELAVLSLIAEQPRHGYEIEQVIEERGMRNWTDLAFSSIYFILKRLVSRGLASWIIESASGRGPAKKVFRVTTLGIRALKDGIINSITTLDPFSQKFILGLSGIPFLSRTEVVAALNERINNLDNKISDLSHHPALIQPGYPPHVTAMFDYSLAQLQSEIDWSKNFLISYKKRT